MSKSYKLVPSCVYRGPCDPTLFRTEREKGWGTGWLCVVEREGMGFVLSYISIEMWGTRCCGELGNWKLCPGATMPPAGGIA